jgi:hypothetical protein
MLAKTSAGTFLVAQSCSYRFGIRPPVVSRIELRLVLLDKAEVFGCWKAFEDRSISACGFILSLVAERGPEKAGGSIPSLATTFSTTYKPIEQRLRSETFQPRGGVGQLPCLGLSESTERLRQRGDAEIYQTDIFCDA